MNGSIASTTWNKVRNVKIICEKDAITIENKVRNAIKEGYDLESVMNGCPGSCPSVCMLMVDRRLPPGEQII